MEHILSLSYGKDSLACLGAIEMLGWPLDRIIHVEVWATKHIPADLPPMLEFKAVVDKIILRRWGIKVEHVCAKVTYQDVFYQQRKSGEHEGQIHGFPMLQGSWCKDRLKTDILEFAKKVSFEDLFYRNRKWGDGSIHINGWPLTAKKGQSSWCASRLKERVFRKAKGCERPISYVGIAADEPKRFHDLNQSIRSPLVEAGWTEAYCRKWAEENDLLAPTYTTSLRSGCWFCHNQGVEQLRLLRKGYPELWALMLKWDTDSPVTFKANGHTVHDYDRRFMMEDEGSIPTSGRLFRWKMLDQKKEE